MKIILAHKYFFRGGGTATYLFALREQLHQMGHETIPFTVAFERTAVDENSEYYVSPPAGPEQDHLKDMTMTPWLALKLLARSTWSVEAYYKARALAEATKPDIAYVHNLYTYMSPSPIAAFRDAGVPVVMRVSDYNMVCPGLKVMRDGRACFDCLDQGYLRALVNRCHNGSLSSTLARVLAMSAHDVVGVYDRIDLFISPSRFMADVLVRAGCDPRRIRHVPSFYPGRNGRTNRPAGGQHILYFGRLSPVKGVTTLLQAYARLDSPPPLVIAGADTVGYGAHLTAITEQLGVAGVRFVGFQGPRELARLIDRSLFTVVPSEWPDNAPMTVLESFAHGKPVIASRVGGVPEQVTPDCGLLFEPGDADELADAMTSLLGDDSLRNRMGAHARIRLREHFAPERHCSELLRHFRRLVM